MPKNLELNCLILKRKGAVVGRILPKERKKNNSVEVTDIKGCHFCDCILYLAWHYWMLNNIRSKTKICTVNNKNKKNI